MAPHSSTLAWRIPWMEEPGGLQPMGSLRVRHDWATSLSCIGKGNGNPLQCSCLENPRDGGAWWAAVCGVAQSRTRLTRLSSSSSSSPYLCSSRCSCSGSYHSNIYGCAHAWSAASVVSDSAAPWTVALQAPLSIGFPRQEYWSGLPCPLPRDLPDSGSNLSLLRWQADSLPVSRLGALSTRYKVSNLIILVISHNWHYYPHFGNEGVQSL